MGQDEERWLGPGEVKAKLGVTAKALRVYEREGLVKPVRTAGGWRAYGSAQIARIHMIIVMRTRRPARGGENPRPAPRRSSRHH